MSKITILFPHAEVDGSPASRAPRLCALRGKPPGSLADEPWCSMRIAGDEQRGVRSLSFPGE
jgi:hypothetical protein